MGNFGQCPKDGSSLVRREPSPIKAVWGQALGVSLWEIPKEQFRAQEHRVAPGSRQELGGKGV